jgi:hypothetical protein
MTKINAFFVAHPEVRSGVRVFVYTFLASFVPAMLGFLGKVLDWTSQDGAAFPSVDTLGKASVAAFVGALAGLIAYGYNKIPKTSTAQYPEGCFPVTMSRKEIFFHGKQYSKQYEKDSWT